MCLCVRESAPTASGSWKFTQLGGFSARQELLSFPRKPDFCSARSWGWSTALHPGDLQQRRSRALAPLPPGCFPPLLSLLYDFYVAFRVDPDCNSRSCPSVWCRPWRVLCTPLPSRRDSALGARPLARALQPGGHGRVLGFRPPPSLGV